jgi:hypothetical protein
MTTTEPTPTACQGITAGEPCTEPAVAEMMLACCAESRHACEAHIDVTVDYINAWPERVCSVCRKPIKGYVIELGGAGA